MIGQASGGKTSFFSFIAFSNLNVTHLSVQYLPIGAATSDERRYMGGRAVATNGGLNSGDEWEGITNGGSSGSGEWVNRWMGRLSRGDDQGTEWRRQ